MSIYLIVVIAFTIGGSCGVILMALLQVGRINEMEALIDKAPTMAEEARANGRSFFRGHPIVYVGGRWVYEDNLQPLPGWGGEARPCKRCDSGKWSGDGHHDECLGLLPGVDNACCGHGDRSQSYIRFTSGVVVRGFEVVGV